MRMRLARLVVFGLLTIPLTGSACEPVLPLFQLLTAPSLAGPIYLTHSLVWLAVAVFVKCFAFIYFERRLSLVQAVKFMLLGNVLSTIPGFFLAVFATSQAGIILALPLVFVLGSIVHHRWLYLDERSRLRQISGGTVLIGFLGFYLVSMLLFAISSGAIEGRHYGGYWIAKFAFVTVTASVGILISAVLEECVIANLARGSHGNLSFFPSVFRANYITLGLILLVAALQMLPKRLKNPDFIADLLHSFAAIFGLV